MRRVTERIGIFCVVGLLLLVSACSLESVRKESGTEAKGTDTTAAATIATATVTPSPTTKPTATPRPTAKLTEKLTPTPTPTINPFQAMVSFGTQNAEKAFLFQDVTAKNISGQAVDLKAGQVVWIYTIESPTTDETSLFFLPVGEEVLNESPSMTVSASNELFFDMSENRYGMTCFSGFPEYELFGTDANLRSNLKRVVEVEPWEHITNVSYDERYVMRIDWDRDGINDELFFESIEGEYGDSVSLTFRSGKDYCSFRKTIQLNSEEIVEYALSDVYIYPETLLLAQKQNGHYVLLICENIATLLDDSEPDGTAAIYYEPDSLFSIRGMDDVFGCEGDVLYVSGRSSFFDGIWTTKRAVRLNDDWSLKSLADTEYYLNSWGSYTYTLQDVNIEIEGTSGYLPTVLSAGMVVIPEKEVFGSDGKGYLYIRLADGSSARIKAEYRYESEKRVALLDGKSDRELFFYIVGS